MPTYEYRCEKGHEFELFQRMSDEPKADCPECGKPSQRLLSAGAGFLFKGDGFYITDYRSDEYRKAAKAEGGSGAQGTKSGGKETSAASPDKPSSGGAQKPKKDAKPGKGPSASSESS